MTVADPGFPVGGVDLVRGAWTPEAVTFRKFCMSKRKNLDPRSVNARSEDIRQLVPIVSVCDKLDGLD